MISIDLEGDGVWPDLQEKFDQIVNVEHIQLSTLLRGTVGGMPSVAIRIDLPDGTPVIAQVTAREFLNAAKLLNTKYAKEGIVIT